jgi:starch phosphorylase
MSQVIVASRTNIDREGWSEITPQALYDKVLALAKNLWWSWHPEVVNLFREIDPIKWRKVDHNPIMLLAEMTPEQLAERAAEMVLYTRINQAHRRLKEYLNNTRTTWGARETGVLGSRPVAYFSAEFGLHESVPIYSGGLGVLSGDHIKSASILRSGLFQATTGRQRLSAGRVSRHPRREFANGAGHRRRRQDAHRLDRNT